MSSATVASRNLMQVLTVPSKVASALDWKKLGGAIATLAIHVDRIEVAVAHHPSKGERSKTFESLPLTKKGRAIPESTRQRLEEIVKDEAVCGFVVSCPVQGDTGALGYAAGRALFTLEQILHQSNVLSPNRPVCLWDGIHKQQPPIDTWGRCSAYARTSSKREHLASRDQYYSSEGIVAAQVWDDYFKTMWPEMSRLRSFATAEYGSETNAVYWKDDHDTNNNNNTSHHDDRHHNGASYMKMAA
jgi:hypothetical protein